MQDILVDHYYIYSDFQIDEDGNVSTVVECTPDSEVNELTTYSIQLKEGKNRLKFVGYDCKNVTFYMEIKES